MSAVTDDAWAHPEKPSRRGFEPLPDIDSCRARYDIVTTDVLPGDVIVFHGLTLHAAAGNGHASRRRRALSLRYAAHTACVRRHATVPRTAR
jgi:ectoine hydroxylase-related dioxygenase (phytanoyl-CoA dioxygenase family)